MSYLRHPPLVFWSLLCAAGVLLVVFGLKLGASEGPALQVVNQRVADERPTGMALVERVGQISFVATPPARELNGWAKTTEEIADSNAKRRAVSSGERDPIALAYAAIARDAEALSVVDASDAQSVLVLQGQIGLDRDRLTAALSGLNVPGMPGAPQTVPTQTNPNDRTLGESS